MAAPVKGQFGLLPVEFLAKSIPQVACVGRAYEPGQVVKRRSLEQGLGWRFKWCFV